MKVIALAVLVAAFSIPAAAKTITSSQGNANERSVAGVAGPAVAANNSGTAQAKASSQPSRKALKKSRIRTPPPMHDPN